jgi:hypothetical protein
VSKLDDLSLSSWFLPELVEAAVRSGQTDVAVDALDRLTERTRAAGHRLRTGPRGPMSCPLRRGSRRRSGGLGGTYREAIEVLGETSMQMFLARAQLLNGEWLRRENRRVDAREQLRAAHEFLERIGAQGFAARAGRELAATGLKVRKRVDETRGDQSGGGSRSI